MVGAYLLIDVLTIDIGIGARDGMATFWCRSVHEEELPVLARGLQLHAPGVGAPSGATKLSFICNGMYVG